MWTGSNIERTPCGDRAGHVAPPLATADQPQPCWCGLLDAVTNSMPDLIYVKDQQCRYVFNNTAHLHFLGFTHPADARGKSVLDLFPPELAGKFYRDERHIIETGEALIGEEEQTVDHFGQPRWVSTTKVPLRDHLGKITGLVGISRDITDRKRAEEALRDAHNAIQAKHDQLMTALSELRAANDGLMTAHHHLAEVDKLQSLTTIAAGIAHDVKSPLAIISLGLEYLRTRLEPDDTTTIILANLATAVRKAGEIIHGLIDFSAPRPFTLASDSLNEIVRKVTGMIRFQLIRRKISHVMRLDEHLPPIRLDCLKAEQAVLNLLNNAIQAVDQGGQLTICTRLADPLPPPRDGEVQAGNVPPSQPLAILEIEDNGPGIAPEALGRLFEPFFTTKQRGQGTGLGLAVVNWIMEAHGGAVRIGNRPEGGACAALIFPLIPGGTGDQPPDDPAGR